MTNTPEYKHWQGMWYRVRHDPRYILKGITACDRWLDFMNFYDDLGPKPEGKLISVDRIDNDGNYEPGNARWTTPTEQIRNRSNTVIIESKKYGSKPQQEWVLILQTGTDDTTWDSRKLATFLTAVTIDQLVEMLKIRVPVDHPDPWAENELVPA